ncbi:mechanosensitive ion channel family protein [Myxococcota bacterium]|nr:mechanosensitive ion channel family protein [Myxococcota bacterium]MBU1380647.1 mechanosensitive ion channel family protein [Myxococcota bacterium]MBU1496989.1 mechanosensitive ion channel family protein [Myxococcota bacterium]
MQAFFESITSLMEKYLNISNQTAGRILFTLIVILAWQILAFVSVKLLSRHVKDLARRYITTKLVVYLFRIAVIIIFFRVWIGVGSGLWAYLGLLSAGIAVALQDSLANFAGWIFIMVSKPFAIGDRIQIDEHAGDIIDIRISQTTILEIGKWVKADQSTGRIIHIPNGWFLKKSLVNFTQKFNFIWNELEVVVTFESDWEKARKILEEIAVDCQDMSEEEAQKYIHQAAQSFLIYYNKLTPFVWVSVADIGVRLTIRYLCRPKSRRYTETRIWESILRRFKEHSDIDFAYPTTRIYYNPNEKKSAPVPQLPPE